MLTENKLEAMGIPWEANVSMRKMNSWRVGGPVSLAVYPENREQLAALMEEIGSEPFLILGNGTNVLVPDAGLTGILIKLGRGFTSLECKEDTCTAGAAIPLVMLAGKIADLGLTGLEFAAGIPGTLGGAVIMNAGAHGEEIAKFLKTVEIYDVQSKSYHTLSKQEMHFNYRYSVLKGNPHKIVTAASFTFPPGNRDFSKGKMKRYKEERLQKQPWDLPNAGSVFKNPPGLAAGALIDKAGLKGMRIGDAQISEKHANFIVNLGNATSAEILQLIQHIEKTVHEKYNIQLEREVMIL